MSISTRAAIHALALTAACGVFIAIVQPGLHGPLVLDSVKLYALEGLVGEYGNLAVFHTPAFDGGLSRIVAMASFVLDTQVAGELSAAQIRSGNAALHVITGLLLYFLTRRIVTESRYAGRAAAVALATSALWLLSPVNLNVVLYAIQRMALLSALFTVLGLLLYVSARTHPNATVRRLGFAVALFLCLPLAALSKENGVLLVPLAFLVEYCVLHPSRPRFSTRQLHLAAGTAAAAAIVAAVIVSAQLVDYSNRDFTLAERVLSQPRAAVAYVLQLLVPFGPDAAIYSDDFAASGSLLSPATTLPALLACAAALALCIASLQGRFVLPAFGIAFFFIGHALESTIFPLELFFMHRNYLPGIGIYIALAALLVVHLPGRAVGAGVILVMTGYYSMLGYARATTWQSRESIVTAAIEHHPDSARAWSGFAQLATESGQFDLAEQAIDRSASLAGTPNTYVQKIYLLCVAGKPIAPADYGRLENPSSFGVPNELSQALANVLQAHEHGRCSQLDVPAFIATLDTLSSTLGRAGRDPWVVDYYTATLLYRNGQTARAHARLQKQFDNGHLESGIYRLELLAKAGADEQARVLLNDIRAAFPASQLQGYAALLQAIEDSLPNGQR